MAAKNTPSEIPVEPVEETLTRPCGRVTDEPLTDDEVNADYSADEKEETA